MAGEFGVKAENIYSNKDRATLGYAKPYLQDPNYCINIIPCRSFWWQLSWLIADHAFMAPTYQKALGEKIKSLREAYGFDDGENR